MKFTNIQMDNYISILGTAHETGKLGYAIAKNIHKLSDAAREYLDMKQELLKKYGKKDKEGNISLSGKDPNFKKYVEEMGDIPQLETDVDIFTIDEETFYNGGLTSDQMTMLLWMVE